MGFEKFIAQKGRQSNRAPYTTWCSICFPREAAEKILAQLGERVDAYVDWSTKAILLVRGSDYRLSRFGTGRAMHCRPLVDQLGWAQQRVLLEMKVERETVSESNSPLILEGIVLWEKR